MFENQILDYLNLKGSPSGLDSALRSLTLDIGGGTIWEARSDVVSRDVTGNTTPDVIVSLMFFEPGQYSEGALFVYRCQKGRYVGGAVTGYAGQVRSAADPDGIRAVADMNGNGVPEIIISYIEIMGTHAYFGRAFQILEWDGQQFVDLVRSETGGKAIVVDFGDGAVQDVDGDGIFELVVTNEIAFAYIDEGAQRRRTLIYAWDGYTFALDCVRHGPPAYRYQAVHDGDDAFLCDDYDGALAFYQQAIFDESLFGWASGQLWPDSAYGGGPTPTPDPNERARLGAYARYKIMLLHVLRGFTTEAEIVYTTLRAVVPEGSAGFPFADLARVFWEAFMERGDLEAACAEAIAFADEHQAQIVAPLGRDFYGFGQRRYQAWDMCPLIPQPEGLN